jgi:hypothetical protein
MPVRAVQPQMGGLHCIEEPKADTELPKKKKKKVSFPIHVYLGI